MKLTILGIETSCDETGVAIYCSQKGMIANALYSQTELHKSFGGVVPEIASRSQLEKINPMILAALEQAQLQLADINCIAVTHKPGLPGSLLVGVCFAKSLAWALNIPIIGINHLEGHAYSAFIEHDVQMPSLCLTASGGHTSLYLLQELGSYTVLGQTVDDAAGEAFDKIAKILELPYPGGPEIEKLAQQVGFQDFFNYPRNHMHNLDFSFSGLKTAVIYDLVKKNAYDMATKRFLKHDDLLFKQQVASSLLVCIADIFKDKLEKAIEQNPNVKSVCFVGGVACNKYIRAQLKAVADRYSLPFFVPSPKYCTDNGGMIAYVGHYKAQQGLYSDLTLDILR